MPKHRRRGLELDPDIEAIFENLEPTSEDISDTIACLGKLIHQFETKPEEWFIQTRNERWQNALIGCIVALHEILSFLKSKKEKRLEEIKAHEGCPDGQPNHFFQKTK